MEITFKFAAVATSLYHYYSGFDFSSNQKNVNHITKFRKENCRITKDELTTLTCLTPQRQVGGAFACAKDMTIGNGVSSELYEVFLVI